MGAKSPTSARPKRAALTLLELLLSLALMGVIVTLLGFAINFHMRVLDSRRTSVEEAQLARAVLQMIANDIRAGIRSEPIDFSTVEDMAASFDMASGDMAGLDDAMSELGLSESDLDQVDTSSTEGIAGSVATPSTPGVYGNRYEMRIDVSRLPRPDQYALAQLSQAASPTDIPSEIKSVAYYVVTDSPAGGSSTGTSQVEAVAAVQPATADRESYGLVRRELSRATTEWAAENGNLNSLRHNTQVIAPEIAHLEFSYFDGTEWLDEWDSSEEGGLPVLVEIRIWVDTSEKDGGESRFDRTGNIRTSSVPTRTNAAANASPDVPGRLYRLLVDIPGAVPTTDDDEIEAEAAAQEAAR